MSGNLYKNTLRVFAVVYLLSHFILTRYSACQQSSEKIKITYIASWYGNFGGIKLKEPEDISVSPQGFVYICDTGNNRILKITLHGDFISSAGGFGWGEKEFDNPVSICAKNGLDVFVADYYNNRLVRFDRDLNYIACLGTDKDIDEDFRFGFPVSVDISDQGELFCVDGENIRIIKFDVTGKPQIEFGGFNAGRGKLADPSAILISENNRIYIADQELGLLKVYDIHGNFLADLGKEFLQKPVGLAEVSRGIFAVPDFALKKVVILSQNNSLLAMFSLSDYTALSFQKLSAAACFENYLFIADAGRSAIDVFKIDIRM